MIRTLGSSCLSLVLLLTSLVAAGNAAEPSWPQFRGPAGQGHALATGLPTTWSESEHVRFKTALPGKGWSSPVVAGNQIWMTTAIDTPADPKNAKERLESNTGNQPLVVSESVSLRAVCVDKNSGELLHDVELMVEKNPQWVHSLNSYASPTPVIAEDRLYCHFGTYGTACLDTNLGEVLWTNRDQRIMHENGPGSSPVLWQDKLIFHCDGSDVQYIVALDAATGKVAWKTDRSGEMNPNPQLKKAYGTPLVVEVEGRPVLLSPGADWLYAYNPDKGEELWKLNYGVLGFSIVPRPVVADGVVYMCTSFMRSQLLAIRYDTKQPEILWRYDRQVPTMSSPVLVGDEIYIVSDKGIATCLDRKSGEVLWQQRLGGNFCASPLYADGKLYFCDREGNTTVIRPGREYQELAVNKLDGSLMASPIALDGSLFLRTDSALYRVEKADR